MVVAPKMKIVWMDLNVIMEDAYLLRQLKMLPVMVAEIVLLHWNAFLNSLEFLLAFVMMDQEAIPVVMILIAKVIVAAGRGILYVLLEICMIIPVIK